uniref:CSON006354 protein n=1 Tax=Culicoides sonorensis TaxID=179676 RepID=A0A336LW03_CULSO
MSINNQFLSSFELIKSAKFDVLTKGIKCYDVNKNYIVNYTCRIFSKKGTSGLVYGNFYVKKVDHVFLNMELQKRYTVTYRPWLLNFTIDCCELIRNTNYHSWDNAAIRLIARVIKSVYPSVFKGCPYEGRYESKKADLNATISPYFPPVMPTGQFKFIYHFFDHLNETIFKAYVELIVKAMSEYRTMDFDFG